MPNKRLLMVILDGASEPKPSDGKPTPLQEAYKPNLDLFAKLGVVGRIENKLADHPDSGLSTWVLLGYPEVDYPGRGWLDALGGRVPQISMHDIFIRANFATVKEVPNPLTTVPDFTKSHIQPSLTVVDRRVGREAAGLADLAKEIEVMHIDGLKIEFYRTVSYRGVVRICAANASEKITGSDPEVIGQPPLEIKPLVNEDSAIVTASALNKWSLEVYKRFNNNPINKYRNVPANYVLLRGASRPVTQKSFASVNGLRAAVVAGSPVVRGIAAAVEMDVINVEGATADLKTNLVGKVMAALNALPKYDMVILHVLGADVAAHDKNFAAKRNFLEKVDREIFARIAEYVDFNKTVLMVVNDHPTSVWTGMHEAGYFPYLIYTHGMQPNQINKFDEQTAVAGPVRRIQDVMEEAISRLK